MKHDQSVFLSAENDIKIICLLAQYAINNYPQTMVASTEIARQ